MLGSGYVDAIPKTTRFLAHGLPVTDTAAEIIMRTRFVAVGIEPIPEGLVDLIHFVMYAVPTDEDCDPEGLYRSIIRYWRN